MAFPAFDSKTGFDRTRPIQAVRECTMSIFAIVVFEKLLVAKT
jgi:hypothetical protein